MSSQTALVLMIAGLVGSTALVGKTVYDTVSQTRTIYTPSGHARVTLVTHNSKKELVSAMRRNGVELGSSDTEYTIQNANGCFIHVVGVPNPKRMDELLANCEH